MRRINAGFPDLECHVEDMTADGDKVWARAKLTGTHHGEFMGVPATGNGWFLLVGWWSVVMRIQPSPAR